MAGNTFFFPWEAGFMAWLQARIDGFGLQLLSFFSAFGEELILILVVGFLYWCYDKKVGKTVGLTALMGMVWNPMIKNIFLRLRPYMVHDGVQLLRIIKPGADPMDPIAQGFSFPSGHSTNAVTVYGSVGKALKKRWLTAAAFLLPLLVGFSRTVVGAHYPTDVLVGWLLGLAAVLLIPLLQKKIASELLLDGILLLTVIPGFFYCRSEDYYTGVGLLIGFLAGTLLERRKVNFESTRSVPFVCLRLIGGLLIYFLLNTLLKLPFPAEFLAGDTLGALMIRCARYAVISLVEYGVYPLLFAWAEPRLSRLFHK